MWPETLEMTTFCLRLSMKLCIHMSIWLLMFGTVDDFCISSLWGTLSNAFAKSSTIAWVVLPLSAFLQSSWKVPHSCVSHVKPLLNPCCRLYSVSSSTALSSCRIICSSSLHGMLVSETGRKLLGWSGAPLLCSGVMWANFHSVDSSEARLTYHILT